MHFTALGRAGRPVWREVFGRRLRSDVAQLVTLSLPGGRLSSEVFEYYVHVIERTR
jgi:hypothetical protein